MRIGRTSVGGMAAKERRERKDHFFFVFLAFSRGKLLEFRFSFQVSMPHIAFQLAVAQTHHALRALRDFVVVRDHDDGFSLLMQFVENS